MDRSCLNFNDPIQEAISRIRFAPVSNNLLISSWDSSLRLYDVDRCELRFEASSGGESVLDCCFESESVALSANSDGSILRSGHHCWLGQKVKFWDARSAGSTCLSYSGMEVESMTLAGLSLMVALKSSVQLYDLRYIKGSVGAEEHSMDIRIKCVRSNLDVEGIVVGSIDGRVALEYVGASNTENQGYAFRCHPRNRNGRHHIVAVNDIAFSPSMHGVIVTGDDEGNAIIWDVLNRKRLVELPRLPNSVASLAFNHGGQLLAIASSYTNQEANEREEPPQIFIHHIDDEHIKSIHSSTSKKT